MFKPTLNIFNTKFINKPMYFNKLFFRANKTNFNENTKNHKLVKNLKTSKYIEITEFKELDSNIKNVDLTISKNDKLCKLAIINFSLALFACAPSDFYSIEMPMRGTIITTSLMILILNKKIPNICLKLFLVIEMIKLFVIICFIAFTIWSNDGYDFYINKYDLIKE
ncbi:hypothetical protein Hokovirus_4_20 [Hokovirus HKV1]|uniref:Uncharacterized protein n=1 Tax=Hokovirus HKV1 TaxID=1977638 RepID=A0A1V0SH37_9VIRU|nr:hypothetical protein Hokovirus_4_20 [Hokovirus HKV1]